MNSLSRNYATNIRREMKIPTCKFAGALVAATPAASPGTGARADDTAATNAVVNHHLQALGAGDVEAMLSDFTPGSVMMMASGNLTGAEQLKPACQGLVAEVSPPGPVLEMQHMAVVDDVGNTVRNAATADNTYRIATDRFVVIDGKIMTQTFTALVVGKKQAPFGPDL